MVRSVAFRFDPTMLDAPRRPGISAIMRIRNGADFLRLAIESHLPHYDEIVACYNDCSDDTERILRDLAARHPGRVRPVHYLPQVHPAYGAAHERTPTDSVHSLANYYNWALSHARYGVAVKLDDDHLAMDGPLARCVARIRDDLARGERRLYTFSGVNLVRNAGTLAVYGNQPLVGTGDIMYFPVCGAIHFRQTRKFEYLHICGTPPPKSYMGLLYFHLKHVKPDLGFGNMPAEAREQARRQFFDTVQPVSIDEFRGGRYLRQLQRDGHNRLEYWLRTWPPVENLVRALSGREPPLRISRLRRLPEDVAGIDWEADLFAPLAMSRAVAGAVARRTTVATRAVSGHVARLVWACGAMLEYAEPWAVAVL